jgi:hypothetical protein
MTDDRKMLRNRGETAAVKYLLKKKSRSFIEIIV